MATPQIPPRPIRQKPSSEASLSSEAAFQSPQAPQIPPRPAARAIDRAEANRDAFAPSPLNDPPFLPKVTSAESPHNGQVDNATNSVQSPPARPPSVKLPSIGQEGNEYADVVNMQQETPLSKTLSGESETTTSHIGSDLPLYAPKPSLSQADQKARVQNVTHTDSPKTVSYGVPRQPSIQFESQGKGLKSKSSTSFRSPSAASGDRPDSTQPEYQGIPEIGIQVPMYPNAGDVQAPSPALHGSFPPPGSAGLHGDSKAQHHGRTRSGREVFHGPPGSYGLHGHGVNATGKFERAWYEKHPEALVQEGVYSPALSNARGEYVLSSEELNKLVQDTASRPAGFGTKPDVVGLPDEQIGYMASEEYASRMASRPGSSYATKAHGNNSQSHIDSPLRTANFPNDLGSKAASGARDVPEALQKLAESQEDSDVIHVDAPEQRYNKVSGGQGTLATTVDLGPRGGNTEHEGGYVDEQGHGVPILASDELRPGSEWQKPAVAPVSEERRSSQDFGNRLGSRPGSTNASRPTSRPTSVHGYTGLSRFTSHEEHDTHTPLDDVEEYEPLFEDDEKTQKKPQTQVERLKHRADARRRFPSQDIWEDTPNSLQLQAEVQTPPPTEEQKILGTPKSVGFEDPAVEAARKGEVSEREKAKLIPNEERLAKSRFKPHIRDEMDRPSLGQRFPSQDIWEDSPDSAHLETTVGEQRAEEDAGLIAGAVVRTSAASRGQSREGATTGASVQPQSIPGAFPITPLPLEEGLSKQLHTLGTTGSGETSRLSSTNIPADSKVTGGVSTQSARGGLGLASQPVGSRGSAGADTTTSGSRGTIEPRPTSTAGVVKSDPKQSLREATAASALPADKTQSSVGGSDPLSSERPAPTQAQRDFASTVPSIPPRPITQDVSTSHTAHPPIPARPSKPHQHHQVPHPQRHAGSPQEQSHSFGAHQSPSEGTREAALADTQTPPPESQGSLPSESRKPPTIPSRPKPHHGPGRADKAQSFGSEETPGAGTSRRVLSPSHGTEGADSLSRVGSETRSGFENSDPVKAPVIGASGFSAPSSGSTATAATGLQSHSREARDLSGKGHPASHLPEHNFSPSGTNEFPVATGIKGGPTAGTSGAIDELSRSSRDGSEVPASHGRSHQASTAATNVVGEASHAEADTAVEQGAASKASRDDNNVSGSNEQARQASTASTHDARESSEPEEDTAAVQDASSSAFTGGAPLPSRHGGSDSSATRASLGAIDDGATSHGGTRDVTSPPAVLKVKPVVPARPGGSKIAALQAGFMSDLNNRLKLGPQPHAKPADKPVEEEKPEEKAPLTDARKARARGPARRKPAPSPGPDAGAATGATGELEAATAAGADSGTSGSKGLEAGSRVGTQAKSRHSQPSFAIFQPICLWQVPNTGVFDPVHAHFVEKVEKPGSLDGVVEDQEPALPKSDAALAIGREPSIEEAETHLGGPMKTAAVEDKPEGVIAEREVEVEAVPAQDTAADTAL